jgi:hypothetical protein
MIIINWAPSDVPYIKVISGSANTNKRITDKPPVRREKRSA